MYRNDVILMQYVITLGVFVHFKAGFAVIVMLSICPKQFYLKKFLQISQLKTFKGSLTLKLTKNMICQTVSDLWTSVSFLRH